MQITHIDIPALSAFGLKAIRMDRLGRVVVLAGKNGAGKTRLLGRVNAWTNEKLPILGLSRHEFCRKYWDLHQVQFPPEHLSRTGWWRNDEAWAQRVPEFTPRGQPEFDLGALRSDLYEVAFDTDAVPQIVRFVPKGVDIKDPNTLTPAQLHEHARKAESVGVSDLHKSVLARIQELQNKWWNATHAHSNATSDEKAEAIQAYEGLCQMVYRFLGTHLDRSPSDEATIFDRSVGVAHLSEGQRVLLQFCVAIHAQAQKLSELIVIMDEPENHLHPGAMLDAINEIKDALSNGQIWIATHSIPLLANFDPESIWWMEDGAVRHAGSQPEVVMRGLVGDEDRVKKLSDFLGLPEALAANNFAHQCLLRPRVSPANLHDPQTRQIQNLIESLRPGNRLRILDFGAGRGRLVSALREDGQSIADVVKRVDYWAYEIFTSNRSECEAAISRLYGEPGQRFLSSDRDARSILDAESVDVVVMCNVLHEIDPVEWPRLFGCEGLLRYLLKPDGFLLIVEDTEMRMGEMAHPRGFLVLDTSELKTLFSIKETEHEFVADDARGDCRLKAHLIPSRCITQVSAASIKKTLQQLRHCAIEEIKRLRVSDGFASYRSGRKHALYVQQLANAQLALELIGE